MATVIIDNSYVQHGTELQKTLDDLTEICRKILVRNLERGDEKTIQYIKEHSVRQQK